MKRITTRLIIQSVGLLLVFATMISIFFGILFAKQTEDMHQEEMAHRSDLISETLSDYFSGAQHTGQGNGSGGYGAFLRFINQIAGENVWVLDDQMNTIINYHHANPVTKKELPKNADAIVTEAFHTEKRQVTKKRSFFQLQEITIANPILLKGKVQAVVLMYSKVDTIHKNQMSGYFMLLLSLLGAVILASLLAWRLSKRFVKPIESMRIYTNELANEHYNNTLSIQTKDELQELGDQLTLLSERLAEAKTERDRKEQSEKDFLSQISHELRTPVMVIKSSLEAINDGYLDTDEEKDYLSHLLKESINLERLVNDLLELSRLQSTEFIIQKEPIDPFDCINDALRSYRLPLKEKYQTVIVTNELDHAYLISGDYLRITQTLRILLDNAHKYAPEHSTIELTLINRKDQLEIALSNELTVPLTNTSHLFDSFKRGNNLQAGGTGLGLSIARQVILKHQGQITAETKDNHFIIKLLIPYL